MRRCSDVVDGPLVGGLRHVWGLIELRANEGRQERSASSPARLPNVSRHAGPWPGTTLRSRPAPLRIVDRPGVYETISRKLGRKHSGPGRCHRATAK